MSTRPISGSGTPEDPWTLRTPPGRSEYQVYRDESLQPPALVCQVGATRLSYDLRCIADLHEMLQEHVGIARRKAPKLAET
jgi:hypothetical protein